PGGVGGAAASVPVAAVAMLRLSVAGGGARVTPASDQDLDALDVPAANAGNQSLDLASPAGAARKVRIYADDIAAARSSIYSALVNANAPGSTTPLDGIFDSGLSAHPNSRIGLAQVIDAHGDAMLLIRPTRIGDLNLDGIVSIADFITLASNYNRTGVTWEDGDINYDQKVTIADFIDLSANFGGTYSGESFPISAPEAAQL